MFNNYTAKALRAVFFARYEVSQLGGGVIAPEHLLLGLLREDDVLLPRLWSSAQAGVLLEIVRQKLEAHLRQNETVSTSAELMFSPELKRGLELATEEAEELWHRHIGTEHQLLGLLRLRSTQAAEVLHGHGITYDGARQLLAERDGQ